MFSNIEADDADFHGDDVNDETFGTVLGHNSGNKDFLEGEGELEVFDFEHFIGDPSVNKCATKLETELNICGLENEDNHFPAVTSANSLVGVQKGMSVIGELEQMLVSAEDQAAPKDKNSSPRLPSHFETMSSDASNIWSANFSPYPISSTAHSQHLHEAFQTFTQDIKQPGSPSVSSNRLAGVVSVDDLEASWLASKQPSMLKTSALPSMSNSSIHKEYFRGSSSKQDTSHMEQTQKMEAAFRKHIASSNSQDQIMSSDLHRIQIHDQDVLTNLLHQLHMKQSLQPPVETSLNPNGNVLQRVHEQNHPSSVFSRSQESAMQPGSSFSSPSFKKSPISQSQLASNTPTLSSPSSSHNPPPQHPQLHQVWQLFFKELQTTFLRIGDSYINELCDFDKFKKDIMELHKVASQRGVSLNIPSAYIDSTFKKLCDAVVSQKQKLMQQKQSPQTNSSSVMESKAQSSSAQPNEENPSTMQHLRLLLQQQQYPQQMSSNRGHYSHQFSKETIGWPVPSNVNVLPVQVPSPVHQFPPTNAQKPLPEPMSSRPIPSPSDPSQLLLQQQAALVSFYLMQQQQQQKGAPLSFQGIDGNELQRQLSAALANLNTSRQVGPIPHYEPQRSPNMRATGPPDQHVYHGNYMQKSQLPEWMDEEVESPVTGLLHNQMDNGNWMMRQEKEWLLRIMTKQISCENPYRQDYYFTRRTLNRMMKQYNDDIRQLQHQGGPQLKPNHPLSYLPSPVTADELMSGHDVIAASLSGHDVGNVEPTPYRPPVEQSDNNLGRLTVSSCYTPRQIIDITTSGGCDLSQWKKDIKTSIPQDCGDKESMEVSSSFLHYKHVLMNIENLYVHVLQLDELTISLQKLVAQTRYRDVMEQYKEKLINHVMKELASKPYGLKNMLTIRKGCSLVIKFGFYVDGDTLRQLVIMCFDAMNEGLAEEDDFGAALSENASLLLQFSVHYQRLACETMGKIVQHCCSLSHLCLHSVPYTLAYELLDQFEKNSQKENGNSFVQITQQWISMLMNFPSSRRAKLLKSFSKLWQVISDHLTAEQRIALEPYDCLNFSFVGATQSSKENSETTSSCNETSSLPNTESELNSLPAS